MWLPPSRQSSFTRPRGALDDDSFRQALRRPSSSEAGGPVDHMTQTIPQCLSSFRSLCTLTKKGRQVLRWPHSPGALEGGEYWHLC